MAYEVTQHSDGIYMDTDYVLSYEDVQEIIGMATDVGMSSIDGMPDHVLISCIDNDTWVYITEIMKVGAEWFTMTWTSNGMTMTSMNTNQEGK